jgi:hypothetical protein
MIMQGSEIHLFPVVIRNFQIPNHEQLNENLINFFRTYPAIQANIPEGVITSRPDLHKVEEECVQTIMGHFNDALEDYRQAYQLCCDRLDITLCWFNHAPARSGFGHPLHRHPMSYVSAVYYLTEGAPTIFDDPCTPRTSDTLDVWREDLMKSDLGINEKIDASPGQLIIFPAWLKHFSGRQMGHLDRWSMSFNAMPAGRVNIGPWGTPQLTVEYS